jgi:hypothetical protein
VLDIRYWIFRAFYYIYRINNQNPITMSRRHHLYPVIFLLTVPVMLLFNGCKTTSLSLDVLVPAQISVPQDIQNVGLVNRSLPQDKSRWANILEGFLSGEEIFGDREGSEKCLGGLASTLNNSPRFKASVLTGVDLRGTGTRQFPPPLDWDRVKQICDDFRVDALVALETFDSDVGISRGEREEERKVDDKKVKVTVYSADLRINVNTGWRIYDPIHETFADMNIYTFRRRWNGDGDTPDEALHELPHKRDAIDQAGVYAGEQYGLRISPTWARVTRSYYSKFKKNPDLELAHRYVKTNDWDKAIEVWKKLVNSGDRETAGMAAYNMALACEMKGNLDIAYSWAKKAYQDYGVKKALSYMNILNQRLQDQQALKEQMGG